MMTYERASRRLRIRRRLIVRGAQHGPDQITDGGTDGRPIRAKYNSAKSLSPKISSLPAVRGQTSRN
jgi:hypothetical protein